MASILSLIESAHYLFSSRLQYSGAVNAHLKLALMKAAEHEGLALIQNELWYTPEQWSKALFARIITVSPSSGTTSTFAFHYYIHDLVLAGSLRITVEEPDDSTVRMEVHWSVNAAWLN